MNKNKICFITCVNEERTYQESALYIKHLEIPAGFEVQLIRINNAPSITAGYNRAMHATDAKYKVYLHQDVFIINKFFIYDVLRLFTAHKELGMMGVVGCREMPDTGMWWDSAELYGTVYDSHRDHMELLKFNDGQDDYALVQGVDGLIIITQYDIPWREDLFTGWHFYDVSQSLEFIRAGYTVGIPKQQTAWCIHDSGIPNVNNGYEEYRKVFLEEYGKEVGSKISQLQPKENRDLLHTWFTSREESTMAKKLLSRSKHILNQHIFAAEQALLADEWEKAAEIVQTAGKDAHYHHAGLFFSADLEGILKSCAEELDVVCRQGITNVPKKAGLKKHVLHVFSEGYETGGHTRLATHWMKHDDGAIHSIISLWAGVGMPKSAIERAESTGGWYINIGEKQLSLLLSAKVLREIAYSWADVVVLHVHPWDVIPSIAFGVDGGPPVILLNHADHVFWLGVFAADMIAEIRPAGQEVTKERRGTQRSMLLTIPMTPPNSQYTRQEAREKIGIDENTILLLSIAATYKYTPCGQYSFLQMLSNITKKYSNVIALIIGPSDENEWKQLRVQTNGRVCAIGTQYNLDIFHAATDIYLDSFSVTSLTASLEAGLKCLPVVYLEKHGARLLQMNDVSFMKENIFPSKNITYEQKVETLIKDISLRKKLGERLSGNIKRDHIDDWNIRLQELYSCLPQSHVVLKSYEKISPYLEEDMIWAYLQYKTGFSYLYKDINLFSKI